MKPYLSIITATYNAAVTLPSLLDSLAAQSYRDFELIIQDALSEDNTVSVAESYRDKLTSLIINSEPDTGIYDAWNKALKKTQGQWIIFLGDGDTLICTATLKNVITELTAAAPDILFAIGGLRQILPDGRLAGLYAGRIQNITSKIAYKMPVHFPSIFFNRKLFNDRKFDTVFKIAGDYEFFAHMWDENKAMGLPFEVTQMTLDGVSSLPQNRLAIFNEEKIIVNRYFGGKYLAYRRLNAYIQHSISKILGSKAPSLINWLRYLRNSKIRRY